MVFLIFFLLGCKKIVKEDYKKKYSNGFLPIKEYGKWTYINSDGKRVFTSKFDDAKHFHEGLAGVLVDSLWGFINTTGKIVIEPKFNYVSNFSDDLCLVKIKKGSNFQDIFIKPDGSTAFISKYKNISQFAYGRATAKINNEVCVLDTLGKIVFNTHFPYGAGSPLKDSIVHVWNSNTTKYFNKNGKLLIELEGMGHNDFNEGVARVRINSKPCYINKKGEIVINPKNTNLTYFDFYEDLASITTHGFGHKSGFINRKGEIIIPIIYSDVNNFSEGLASYRDSLYWGFMNKKGKTVIPAQFQDVSYDGFTNGLCKVKKDGRWSYINHKGKFVWEPQNNIQYKKLDLSKWNLDSLDVNIPIHGGKYTGEDNKSRAIHFKTQNTNYIKVDTTDITVFADKFFGYKIQFINGTNDTIHIPTQDGRIKLIQQAKNEKGEWLDIEKYINSFCGNSYYTLQMPPKHYQIFITPITKGNVKTKLRFRLNLKDTIIYSNEYYGTINQGQYINL